MHALSPADWPAVEPLFDALLSLPPSGRQHFLDTLPPEQQRWRATLDRLLQAEAAAAGAGFLSHAASLAGGTEGAGAASPQWQAGQHIGPWALIEELGRGGMACVWRARPHSGDFQREVALKLPHSPAPGWLERLKRERDLLARLYHAGIARLYDAGVDGQGLPWLAMECVQGRDILGWCEARQSSVRERLGLLLQVADALQYAHSRLVMHRDIKPANVMVQDDGQVRLLDFGIARGLAPEDGEAALTQVGQRPMTPEYASPEQVRGEELGIASDVYALGVLAYRLLVGVSPYAAAVPGSRHALERAVLEMQPPAPSGAAAELAARKSLRGDLDAIVLKALAKEPGRRYATMDALAADLQRYLAGEAVQARPPSWRYRVSRFTARHRWAVGMSTLAVVALLGTTGWALQAAREARQEARRSGAMYDFVKGLFNPSLDKFANVTKPDMTLREVVELGARRILTELKGEPDVRFGLLQDLTPLTEQLGLIDLSTTLDQARVDDALRTGGEHSLVYADALRAQLGPLESTGQFQLGYDNGRKALALYEALGVRDPATLAVVHEKIGGFGFRLHPPSAEDAAHLQRAVDLQESLPFINTLGQTYLLLGLQRVYLGDLDAARKAGFKGIEANRKQFGIESWQAALAESIAAIFSDMLQRPGEAEALLRHAVDTTRKVQGPDAIGLARAEIGLASVLFAGAQREEARRVLADAQRITALPANASFGAIRGQVAVGALGLALRGGDSATVKKGCEPYRDGKAQATSPYFGALVAQACSAAALAMNDPDDAAHWLAGTESIDRYFAQAPVWTMALNLRRGELAQARGDAAEALRLWRKTLAVATTAQLPAQARAWWQLARHAGLDAGEREQLGQLRQALEAAGGERYYAEHLALLRQAQEAQQHR